jgi:hypothetical protein
MRERWMHARLVCGHANLHAVIPASGHASGPENLFSAHTESRQRNNDVAR